VATAHPRLTVVRELGALLRAAPPRAGRTRVIAIDGRSGSGKSTLAALLREELDAPVVGLEGLYGGWDGLEHGVDLLVSEVLEPLAAGRAARVPHYDWIDQAWDDPIELSPPGLLIVEGSGAGARRAARHASVLVWLEATDRTRRKRALDRDGDMYRPHWERWAAQEAAMREREATRDRADAVVRTDAAPDPSGPTGLGALRFERRPGAAR
jgi:uridine kinase